MYVGKHVVKQNPARQKKPERRRKRGYLRVFILWSILIFVILAGASFIYAKYLEARIHNDDRAYAGNDEDFELTPPVEDKPITFVLLGSDSRGEEGDIGRSDTLMVFRINPKKKIGYLISIPRDARVDIPGHGKQKINAAYQFGGPRLVIKTVEKLSGLKINHYAVVDFEGFKEIVDALGGIDIDVEKKLVDLRHGINIRPGYQHMDGEEALKYVRIRHCDDDFGRMGRQQKFIRAVMDKLLRLSNVIRIPQLAEIASRNVRTDKGLGITQMINYGQQIRTIGRQNIHMLTLPGGTETIGGISYVILDKRQADWIFERIKNDMPLTLTEEEKQNKNIKIEVQNGSGKPGMAKAMGDKLTSLQFKVTELGNANSFNYYETQIVVAAEKEELGRRVQSALGFGHVSTDAIPSDSADVVVIVGRDFVYMNDDRSDSSLGASNLKSTGRSGNTGTKSGR